MPPAINDPRPGARWLGTRGVQPGRTPAHLFAASRAQDSVAALETRQTNGRVRTAWHNRRCQALGRGRSRLLGCVQVLTAGVLQEFTRPPPQTAREGTTAPRLSPVRPAGRNAREDAPTDPSERGVGTDVGVWAGNPRVSCRRRDGAGSSAHTIEAR